MKLCIKRGNKTIAQSGLQAGLKENRLTFAYLCEDCGAIGDASMTCPGCQSGVHVGLSGVPDSNEKLEESNLFRFPGLAA